MRIEVMNRPVAEARSQIERHEDKVIISIYTPSDNPAAIDKDNPTVLDVLTLCFEDCDETDRERYDGSWVFNEDEAELIFWFVEQWKDKVDSIWVHCDGGVSRSAGVAAALLKHYTGDDSQIFDNPKYYPNSLVYSTCIRKFQELNS